MADSLGLMSNAVSSRSRLIHGLAVCDLIRNLPACSDHETRSVDQQGSRGERRVAAQLLMSQSNSGLNAVNLCEA